MVSSFNEIGCSKGNQWTAATCHHEGNSELYTKQGKKTSHRQKCTKFKNRQNQQQIWGNGELVMFFKGK